MESEGEAEDAAAGGAAAGSSSGLRENMETMFELGKVLLALAMAVGGSCVWEDCGDEVDEARAEDALANRDEHRYFVFVYCKKLHLYN